MSELQPAISYERLKQAIDSQSLFDGKSWRLSPEPLALSRKHVRWLERIGPALQEFLQALDTLYLASALGKPAAGAGVPPKWTADSLDAGKPGWIVDLARDSARSGSAMPVMRPDILVVENGLALTEIDSLPGGVGLTAYLQSQYAEGCEPILGVRERFLDPFWRSLDALSEKERPRVAIIYAEEGAMYWPEFDWIAEELRGQDRFVWTCRVEDVRIEGGKVLAPSPDGAFEPDIVYRFFELYDPGNAELIPALANLQAQGRVTVAPAMKHHLEEKLALALFWHPGLAEHWSALLSPQARRTLQTIIPRSWIIDPRPAPLGARLWAPELSGRPMADWRELAEASQKEREIIIKRSGFSDDSWGARSVAYGADLSREAWSEALERALALAANGEGFCVAQEYRKPIGVSHRLYEDDGSIVEAKGRTRLCPYYFSEGADARLGYVLSTACPMNKKIIHGMSEAALSPAQVVIS